MSTHAEVAILGGGCAGLSLAHALAVANSSCTAVVIEQRAEYLEDRTWCGWATEPHLFDRCVRRRWPRWRVSTTDARHEIAAGQFTYESIAAGEFYATARGEIAAAPRVELLAGATVANVVQHGDGAKVTLADGRCIDARWVIDTIPQPRELSYPWMWQSFVGIELEAPGAGGDDVPDVMDFRVPQLDGLTFLYVIPFGRDRALFELTCFSPQRKTEPELHRALLAVLAQRFSRGYRVLRTEHAHLPMSPSARRRSGHLVPAGITGGAMRPATGFAFHSIQRWAARCAADLAAGRAPVASTMHPALLWMDRVFMSVVRDKPENAPALYARLFSQTEPDALVRFLAGIPRVADIAGVVASLPLGEFTRAAAHVLVA